ncbi:MAG: GRRM system radical SAM/SPASM domain protein [Negativicutes bacterium]|nr:GRRM system radical SAM/SPASM domain protein [Negativicutes bacterium]
MSARDYAGRLRQMVMQPTPFCNLDCDYCYLPFRDDKTVMSLEVVAASLRFALESGLLGSTVEMRWHAGEPLAVRKSFYHAAFEMIDSALADTGIHAEHSVQTNGVLIDEEWAEFFAIHDVRVGVSLDGPAHIHDAHRRTRRGSGSFAQVMRGIEYLRAYGLPFDVISVITPATLADASGFRDFFSNLPGLRELGFNVEESEGAHQSQILATDAFEAAYRLFLGELHRWSWQTSIPVREFRAMRDLILYGSTPVINTQNDPFSILTVAANGDISTFSPELLGLSHPAVESFILGNVLHHSHHEVFKSKLLADLALAIDHGRMACQSSCAYYSLCGGGAPVNKLYENGSLSSTRTRHCYLTIQMIADCALSTMENERF